MNIRNIHSLGRSLAYGALLLLPLIVAACNKGGGSSSY